jgi:hypothetical protein
MSEYGPQTQKPKYWMGSEIKTCDLCSGSMAKASVMYDATLPGVGWCNCCHSCFQAYRGKLGEGRGQKYKRTPEGWLLVKGGGNYIE